VERPITGSSAGEEGVVHSIAVSLTHSIVEERLDLGVGSRSLAVFQFDDDTVVDIGTRLEEDVHIALRGLALGLSIVAGSAA
jgi:hypothetical protein